MTQKGSQSAKKQRTSNASARAALLRLTLGTVLMSATPAYAKVSDAEAALIGAVVSQALGGKTTLGDKAGTIEGWMVSASLLESAAVVIKKKVGTNGGLILAGEEAPNLGLPDAIRTQVKKLSLDFPTVCKKPDKSEPGVKSDNVNTALATAISGAAKAETTITGYTIAHNDYALIDALLGQLGDKWVRLEDLGKAASSAQIVSDWENMRLTRNAMTADCEKSDSGKALLKRFDEMDTQLIASTAGGGPSILEQAARTEFALSKGADLKILRVHIEHVGGSVTNTNNFATRLGLPAVRMTGGLVVRFRQVDAATGKVESGKAGLIVCHSPRRTIGALHRGKLPATASENCTPSQ